jgi:protein-tyrosine phosphatase
MMLTELPYGTPGRVFRSPMPFAYFDRMRTTWQEFLDNNIDGVVLLNEHQEYLLESQRDLKKMYSEAGMKVIHLPIPDFGTTEREAFETAIDEAINHIQNGGNLAIHCLAGLGRTGMFAACLAKRLLDFEGEEAINWVRSYVPGAVENPRQEDFVHDF